MIVLCSTRAAKYWHKSDTDEVRTYTGVIRPRGVNMGLIGTEMKGCQVKNWTV